MVLLLLRGRNTCRACVCMSKPLNDGSYSIFCNINVVKDKWPDCVACCRVVCCHCSGERFQPSLLFVNVTDNSPDISGFVNLWLIKILPASHVVLYFTAV